MSLSYALLGLLSYTPMSGYDLMKFFNDSINFFWSAQTSQIYRELKTLEEKACITSLCTPSEKGPDRRVYRITDIGRSRLRDWLYDFPEYVDEDNRNAFLLRVFLSSNVGLDELYCQIQKRLTKYRQDYQALKAVEGRLEDYLAKFGQDDKIHYWRITLSRGFHDVESHIKWAEETIRYISKVKEGAEK